LKQTWQQRKPVFAKAELKNRDQSELEGSISALRLVPRGIPTWSHVMASGMAVIEELENWRCSW